LESLEEDDVDVDELAERVQRASLLIELCRERIGKAKLRIEEVVAAVEVD
jgi:exodeoxyribonuclease VII small subunit